MTAVILTIASAAFGYLLDGVLVGAFLGASRLRWGTPALSPRVFVGLLTIFGFVDLYWIPAALALDLTISIGNSRAADVFGRTFPSATWLLTLGWFEVIVWAAQGLVAVWIADLLSRREDAT